MDGDPRTRRTVLLVVPAIVLLAGSVLLLRGGPPLSSLRYVGSAALFLAALFFGSGVYAVWTGQIGAEEPERDRED